ncbi:MAG: GNAT family N-acetyltransferase [Mogibacterium sp.]|nr:GNAT family N-acetyltransferase [Mogibacterium sp.]
MNHVGTIEIKTDRLVLRPFREEDIDSFYKNYGSDPVVHKYVSFVPCRTEEETAEFVRSLTAHYDEESFYAWAMVEDGVVFGYVGLVNVDETADAAELRFSFGSKWWWKGYSTESTKAIRDLAFETIGIHRLYSSHHVENVSSGSTLLKIGMEPEGVLRGGYKNEDGTYADMKQYSVLAEDIK